MNTIGSHSWHPTEEEREEVQARFSVSSHRKEAVNGEERLYYSRIS